MGNSSSRSESRVVVVGGGYAGVTVAFNLDNYCHVTLIDPKPYFHHCIASLRAAVGPESYEKKTMIPYEPSIKNGVFKQGTVVSVNSSEKHVVLQNAEKIPYDYLVFACGSTNDFPGTSPNDLKWNPHDMFFSVWDQQPIYSDLIYPNSINNIHYFSINIQFTF